MSDQTSNFITFIVLILITMITITYSYNYHYYDDEEYEDPNDRNYPQNPYYRQRIRHEPYSIYNYAGDKKVKKDESKKTTETPKERLSPDVGEDNTEENTESDSATTSKCKCKEPIEKLKKALEKTSAGKVASASKDTGEKLAKTAIKGGVNAGGKVAKGVVEGAAEAGGAVVGALTGGKDSDKKFRRSDMRKRIGRQRSLDGYNGYGDYESDYRRGYGYRE